MALIYVDGFDAGDHAARWASVSSNPAWSTVRSLVAGRFGSGQALQLAASSGTTSEVGIIKYFTNAATVHFGGAFKINYTPQNDVPLLHFGGFGGTANIGLWITPSLGLQVWRHIGNTGWMFTQSSGTALASGSEGFVVDQWVYLEVMVTVADAGGRVVVKKNGNTIVDFTGDTRSTASVTGVDSVMLAGVEGTAKQATWDDIYILNTSGSVNNTYQGDVEIRALLPDANGNYSGFTGSDGNSIDNYQLIDDTNMADYVASSVVGTKDSYNLPNVASVNIKGVQTVVQGNQADAGSAAVRPFVRIGGTDYPTTTQYLGQQTITTYPMDVSPATSSTWGVAELNGTELGVEVV